MGTFYFDTGVHPENTNGLHGAQVWRNGTKQIPFECDAPEGSALVCMCNNPDMPMYRNAPGVKVFPVRNTDMASRYAYMRVPKEEPK
jgi:hypothetical protein